MVDRFNALATRGIINLEVWFNSRTETGRSWTVDESSWQFDYRYIPHATVKGRGLGFPPPLLAGRAPSALVSLHGEPSFVAGWHVARWRGIPTALEVVKTFDTWVARKPHREALKRYIFPRTNLFFVPGDDARRYVRQYGADDDHIMTLPEPVDSRFVTSAKHLHPSERQRIRDTLGLTGTTFLYVGRLWWGKGLRHLFGAFEAVQQRAPDVSLLIVGDGDERAALEHHARQVGLRNVVFAGFHQNEDLPRFYAAADVFVFPTLGDPFGQVVDEAMCCGLPVISTSAAGEITDRIRNGRNGFIVPPGQAAPMADRMLDLVHNASRRRAMGQFGKDQVTGRTRERWCGDLEMGIERLLTPDGH
jgi:glycosyltransferase involved in cell wall biosynthesis